MKLKTLATIAALAAISAPAMANIKQVNNGTSELFLVVGDQNGSFMLDTGVTLASLLTAPASFSRSVASTAWTNYTAADTNLLDGASNSTTGTRWALFVYDGYTLPEFDSQRVITTLGKGLTTASISFDGGTMNQANAQTGNLSQAANGTGTHINTANGSSYNVKGTPGYAGANFFRFSDANTFIGNKVGDSSKLFLLQGDATDGSDPTLPIIATQLGLTASFNGTTLAVTAAVPEPESYALLVAGLAAVCFVARRRAI
ncbi:PEP-CTERM sorting domain-containing protein [Roseateles sp. P5_D6]